MGGKVVKFGTMVFAHYEPFPVYLQNLQFRLQYIEANSPVNLRILLQFLQLQRGHFLEIQNKRVNAKSQREKIKA
jgi:hypothetical protein